MPEILQTVLVQLIEDDPTIVDWMLGLTGDRHARSRCDSASLLRRSSESTDGLGLDAVVRLDFADGAARIVVCKVLAEWNPAVYHRLPVHVAGAFEYFRLPVSLLLLCRTDLLARRYRRGIETGPESRFAAAAVGPSDMPEIITDASAPSAPAVLASVALRRGAREQPVELFVATIDHWLAQLGPEQAAGYASRLLRLLPEQSSTLLRAVMESGGRHYHAKYRSRIGAARG
ncbi:hypothetical protein [Glycomyces rhizosphaerae]|uniref:Uncharacterized protein n=1 Tax=Glycomyces rhizosphaerae TaxID=2054422 RepID=A0ABV7Q4N6_9ACTN